MDVSGWECSINLTGREYYESGVLTVVLLHSLPYFCAITIWRTDFASSVASLSAFSQSAVILTEDLLGAVYFCMHVMSFLAAIGLVAVMSQKGLPI